jgi:hypothetical protein
MRWRVGEENCGGGFNIYRGNKRVAHTSEVSAVNAASTGTEPVSSDEAKYVAIEIVRVMNKAEGEFRSIIHG